MAISFVGSHIGTHAATSAQTINFSNLKDASGSTPTLQQNDLVVLTVFQAATATRTQAQLTPSTSGYLAAHASVITSSDSQVSSQQTWYKFMPASPDTAVLVPASASTTAGIAYSIHVFRGVDPAGPIDVTAITATGTNGAQPNPGAITPSTAGAWIYIAAGGAMAAGAAPQSTAPTGMSTGTNAWRTVVLTTTTNDPGLAAGYKSDWTSGAYDCAALTGYTSTNTGSWTAVTIALRPFVPTFTPSISRFRFYNDDGSESAATAKAAENTNINLKIGDGIVLRFQVQETAGAAGASTDDWQLRCRKNGGAWFNCQGTSPDLIPFSSTNLTDQGATTGRLTAGTGSFVAGLISEDGLADNLQLTASNYTEVAYTIQASATGGEIVTDFYEFKLALNGVDLSDPTSIPKITIIAGSTYSLSPTVQTYTESVTNFNNYLIRSAEFDNTGTWTDVSGTGIGTRTANATTAPDGSATADQIAEAAASTQHGITQSYTSPSTGTFTGSFYIKKGPTSRDWFAISFGNLGTTYFNITTGVMGSTSGGTFSMQDVGSGWWRIALSGAPGSGAQSFSINSCTGDATPTFLGSTSDSFYIWGAQVNSGSVPTAPIITTTATSTAILTTQTVSRKLAPTAQTYALTMQTVVGKRGYQLVPTAQTYTLTMQTVTSKAVRKLAPTAQTYVVSGSATLQKQLKTAPTVQTYSLTMQNLLFAARRFFVAPTVQTYTLSMQSATLQRKLKTNPTAQTYTLTMQSSSLIRGYNTSATMRTYTLTMQTVIGQRKLKTNPTAQTYAVSGSATPRYTRAPVVLGPMLFTVTTQNVQLDENRKIVATTQTFSVTPQNVGLLAARKVNAQALNIQVTAPPVTLIRRYDTNATVATYSVSGSATLQVQHKLNPTVQTYSVNPIAISINDAIVAGTAFYSFTAFPTATIVAHKINPTAQTYTVTMQTVTPRREYAIAPTAATFTVTPKSATLQRQLKLNPTVQSYVVTTFPAVNGNNPVLNVTSQSFFVNAQNAQLTVRRKTNPTVQTFAVTGQSAALDHNYHTDATTQTYAVTPKSATLLRKLKTNPTAQTFSVTPQSTTLSRSRMFAVTSQTFAVSGSSTLKVAHKTVAANTNYIVSTSQTGLIRRYKTDLNAVSFVVSGSGSLKRSYAITPSTAVYTVSTTDTQLGATSSYVVSLSPLTFAVSTYVTSSVGRKINPTPVTFTVTGQNAVTKASRRLSPTVRTFTVSGSATINRTYVVVPTTVTYSVTPNNAGTVVTRKTIAQTAIYGVSGSAGLSYIPLVKQHIIVNFTPLLVNISTPVTNVCYGRGLKINTTNYIIKSKDARLRYYKKGTRIVYVKPRVKKTVVIPPRRNIVFVRKG